MEKQIAEELSSKRKNNGDHDLENDDQVKDFLDDQEQQKESHQYALEDKNEEIPSAKETDFECGQHCELEELQIQGQQEMSTNFEQDDNVQKKENDEKNVNSKCDDLMEHPAVWSQGEKKVREDDDVNKRMTWDS